MSENSFQGVPFYAIGERALELIKKMTINKMTLNKMTKMGLNTTEIILIPVLVFVVIIFAIVGLAHVNRFIMEHRRYCPTFYRRQRLLRRFHSILLTIRAILNAHRADAIGT